MAAQDAPLAAGHAGTGQCGQAAIEHVGILLLVAAIVAAIAISPLGTAIADGVDDAVCTILSSDCDAPGSGPPSQGGSVRERLQERERALAPFAADGGDGLVELLDQARSARLKGDLDQADQLLDRAELYRTLAEGGRGDVLLDTVGPTNAQYDDLVDKGTIEMGDTNRRYFEISPGAPGDGVLAFDFFIGPARSAFLRGDDRGVEDPLLGDLDSTDSRITIVLDRESGRGVITQSETCTNVPFGNFCQAPRPIDLGEINNGPLDAQVLPSDPNEFDIQTTGDGVSLRYDGLNSITPLAFSVDGGVTLSREEDGSFGVTEDNRDDYPSRSVYQYRPGENAEQLDYQKGKDLGGAFPIGAVPECDLPKLPFGGPDLPKVPGPCF